MSNALPPGYAVPNTSLPKTTGTINIIFGSILLVFGLIQLAMTVGGPALMEFAQNKVDEAQAPRLEARKQQLEDLRRREAEAEGEGEKAKVRAEIEGLEARPLPKPPDMKVIADGMKHPALQAYTWADLITGLLLNGAMLASGIGLLRLGEGARRLAIWVGGLKIARILLLALVNLAVIMPISLKLQQEMMADMVASGGVNAQTQAMAKMGAAAGMAMVVLWALLGMIWPIVMIVLLSRPGCRAACLGAAAIPTFPTDRP